MFYLVSTGKNLKEAIPGYLKFVIFCEVSVDFFIFLSQLSHIPQQLYRRDSTKNSSLKLYFVIVCPCYLFSTSNINSQKIVKSRSHEKQMHKFF